MPITLHTQDKHELVVGRVIKHMANASGLIICNVPKNIVKLVGKLWEDETSLDELIEDEESIKSKNIEFAKSVRTILVSAHNDGICRVPLDLDFSEKVLSNNYHNDTTLYIGLNYSGNKNRDYKYRVASIAAWAAADSEDYIEPEELPANIANKFDGDEPIEVKLILSRNNKAKSENKKKGTSAPSESDLESELMDWLQTKSVAEIDLVCATGKGTDTEHNVYLPRSGQLLLLHTLQKIAAIKKKGERLYNAVLIHVAKDETTESRMEGIITKLGFKRVKSWWNIDINGKSDYINTQRDYYILADKTDKSWIEVIADKIDWDNMGVDALCPVRPKSGRQLCA